MELITRSRHARQRPGECRVLCINEEEVARARAASPGAQVVLRIADRFSALADPTRLRILLALMHSELCVCDLASVVERSMPGTSQQLKLLRNLGLVTYRMQGKLAYYSISDEWVRSTLTRAVRPSRVSPPSERPVKRAK